MKISAWLVLGTTVCSGLACADPAIYGITGGSRSPWTLFNVSSATGAANEVGPILGVGLVTAAAFAPDGSLFSSAQDFFFNQQLATLDPLTGAVIRDTPLTGVPSNWSANAYAFSPDGTLYALYGNQNLYSIDTTSSAATLLGSVGPLSGAGSLSVSSGGTLFLADPTDLYTMDPNTAALSLVTSLKFSPEFGESGPPNLLSMVFDPATGALYTSAAWYSPNSPWPTALGVIDPAAGDVVSIGPTDPGLTALAIEATPAPEPSYGLLIPAALAILLAFRLKRRRCSGLKPSCGSRVARKIEACSYGRI